MSDTHDKHAIIDVDDLPKGNIFIHAGDFTKYSRKPEL
jgi:predicted phosphodiesterase